MFLRYVLFSNLRRYFSTGSFDIAAFYHYGLATQFYTHFTYALSLPVDSLDHLFDDMRMSLYIDSF